MGELAERNEEAVKLSLGVTEERLQKMELEMTAMRNNVQTLTNLVGSLQKTNTLALARLRGGGSTSE